MPFELAAWVVLSFTQAASERQSPPATARTITGTVRDARDRSAIPNAVVREFVRAADASVPRWTLAAHVATDEHGKFVLKNAPNSEVAVCVEAPGHAPAFGQAKAGSNEVDLELDMARGCCASVSLRSAQGRSICRWVIEPEWTWFPAGEEGPHIKVGRDFSVASSRDEYDGSGEESVDTEVDETDENGGEPPGGGDESGGSAVRAGLFPTPNETVGPVVTAGLPAGQELLLEVKFAGSVIYHAPHALEPKWNEISAIAELPVVLRGRLVDRTGKPIPSWPVGITSESKSGPTRWTHCLNVLTYAPTDSEGRFELHTPRGRFVVGPLGECCFDTIECPASERVAPYGRVFDTRDEAAELQEIVLPADRGLFIRGKLAGDNLPRAVVVLLDETTGCRYSASDVMEDGTFTIGPVPAGKHEVAAIAIDENSRDMFVGPEVRWLGRKNAVEAGTSSLVLEREPGRDLSLSLESETGSGEPCSIEIRPVDKIDRWWIWCRQITAHVGEKVTLTGLLDGTYSIFAVAEEEKLACSERVTVSKGAPLDLALHLRPAALLRLSNRSCQTIQETLHGPWNRWDDDPIERQYEIEPQHEVIRVLPSGTYEWQIGRGEARFDLLPCTLIEGSNASLEWWGDW